MGVAVVALGLLSSQGVTGAGDFGYAWRAAQYLLSGADPYAKMDPSAPYGHGGPFLYPFPAAVVAVPVAALPAGYAALVFTSLSVAIFAYAMTSRGWWGLLGLVSTPAIMTVMSVNWGFLLAASAMLPGAGWLAAAKPNLGLVALVYRWERRALVGCVMFGALTLLLRPGWPASWFAHLHAQPIAHVPLFLWPLGALGLVGFARWRTREGRALAAYTLVPVSLVPTDHLMLWLVPRTCGEMLALTASSWLLLPVLLGFRPGADPVSPTAIRWLSTMSLTLPCAVMVWRRKNVSS